MTRNSYLWINAQQAHQSLQALWLAAKPLLLAGHRLRVTVAEDTRSLEQNSKLHACLSDISDQLRWYGKKLSIVTWKRLCIASWLREIGEGAEMVPALDGNGFDVIYEKSSKLTITQCSSLIEWILKFGAEQDVKFRDLDRDC